MFPRSLRPYYTMHCSTGVFHFTSRFSFYLAFLLAFMLCDTIFKHVGKQNTRENARKMQEKREKNPKREPYVRKCFYIILCVVQKRESVAFCSRFARFLLTFCLHFAHKLYQNANPTHSVIWPLELGNRSYV